MSRRQVLNCLTDGLERFLPRDGNTGQFLASVVSKDATGARDALLQLGTPPLHHLTDLDKSLKVRFARPFRPESSHPM